MQRLEINQKVLSKNDEIAKRLREYFKLRSILALNLVSSPGSGKTTLLEKALPILNKRHRLAVIEGDLRTENDALRLRRLGIDAFQIETWDACHLEALDIERIIPKLADDVELLIIENVGNLVCTASYDLGEDYTFVLLSTAEGDDKPAKYPIIFLHADFFILSKIDLLPYLDFNPDRCRDALLQINSKIEILPLSAKTGEGLEPFIDTISRLLAEKKSNDSRL
ncbi:MAG: hydrogenase nickel incorporation protein HypB [Deferribacteraceae bacterium]|jgi:hydrogenase nickel incorporation protein HypB|nr:hydrogenase nickel incorporation protein HypB [Deferribacteraceae bacterium]